MHQLANYNVIYYAVSLNQYVGNISLTSTLYNGVHHHQVLIKSELAKKSPINNNTYASLNACLIVKQYFHSYPKQSTFKPDTNPGTQKPINYYLNHGLHKINEVLKIIKIKPCV